MELDKAKCNYCTKTKSKLFSKYRGTQRIYIDNATGKEWSGARCPECYEAYKLAYDKKRRLKSGKVPLGTACICRSCGKEYILLKGMSSNKCLEC